MDKRIKRFGFIFLVSSLWLLFYSSCLSWATAPRQVPSGKGKTDWRYIVIHHSATRRGNAGLFDKYHYRRGMKNGLAYHFVIDNGTCGKRNGQLEIGRRWKKQIYGGHVRQQWLNEQGIGICLVGNFNEKPPTRQQLRTLINLVKELQKRYNIPIKNIKGHGQFKGENTECPGRYFPWRDFYAQLRGLK